MLNLLNFVIGILLCSAAFVWIMFEVILSAVVIVFGATWILSEFVVDEIYAVRRSLKCCHSVKR